MTGRNLHDDSRSRISGKFRSTKGASRYADLMGNCLTMKSQVLNLTIHWIVYCFSVLGGMWDLRVIIFEQYFGVRLMCCERVWLEIFLRHGSCISVKIPSPFWIKWSRQHHVELITSSILLYKVSSVGSWCFHFNSQ